LIPFLKMHGLGNDFVVIDDRDGNLPALKWSSVADRNFGIGCDQVVILEKSAKADVFMRIYNADGGEVASCGNASRCVAKLMHAEQPQRKSITIETLAGVISAVFAADGNVTIDMGEPGMQWEEIPLKEKSDTLHLPISLGGLQDPVAVSMGNPHMVFFVADVNAVPLATLGPELEKHPLFPACANVGVAQLESKSLIHLRVWERGSGLTLACGTGACAAAVAAFCRGLVDKKVTVKLPGGMLLIEWRGEDNHVLMSGPAETAFSGAFDPMPWRVRQA
jgi:diaminopimelate epimerase